MNEKEQLEELADWLSTCPTKAYPICYLASRYDSVQVIYSDMIKAFPEANVEGKELAVYHNGVRIFCILTYEQLSKHVNWEEMV
jgi:hypothetical protein